MLPPNEVVCNKAPKESLLKRMDNEKVRRVFYADSSPFYTALFLKKSTNPYTTHLYNPNQKGSGLLTDSQSGKTMIPIVRSKQDEARKFSSPSPPPTKRKGSVITGQPKPKNKKQKGESTLDNMKIRLFRN